MTYTSYITTEGDRWDTIAYEYLGDATAVKTLFDANPLVPLKPEIAAATEIFIPIFTEQEIQDINNLPPWKR